MSDDYPNRALWLADRLETIQEDFASAWVWMFTVVVLALFAIVFNELHQLGAIETAAAEDIAVAMQIVAAVAGVMLVIYGLSLLFGVIGWRLERGDPP